MPRHFAAMGLARCRRLLQGMVALREAGVPDAAGVLFRPLWETWLVSIYALYGGDQAYEEIRDAGVEQVSKLPDTPFAEAKQLLRKWPGPKTRLNIEQIATKVSKILKGKGEHHHQLIIDFYNVLYRGESTLNIHAGVHSIAGHLIEEKEYVAVNPVRYSPDEGVGSLLLAATFTGILAKDVFSAFGLKFTELDSIANEITEGISPDSIEIEFE